MALRGAKSLSPFVTHVMMGIHNDEEWEAAKSAFQPPEFEVLDELAFSAELKRMGVLLRDRETGQVTFYAKGADNVMQPRVARADWLEEEVGNLAREGLRTLVVACKALSQQQYDDFRGAMHAARLAKSGRAEAIGAVWDMLQEELTLLCVAAVEDKLQVAQTRPVIDGEELVVAEGAHPAADGDILPDVYRVEQFGNGVSLHAGKDAAIQAGFGVLVSSAETTPSRRRTTRWA